MGELTIQTVTERITPELTENVKRGARFLDEVHPDWYNEINAETLRMDDPSSCMLGQTFGWSDGVQELYDWLGEKRESYYNVDAHGFDVSTDEDTELGRLIRDNYGSSTVPGPRGRVSLVHIAFEILGVLWTNEMKARYEGTFATDVLG